MVSVEQLTALIEFMECHTEVALGCLNRSKEGRSQTKRLWEECAADCIPKTADQWRLYYNEFKCKLMKKIKIEKAEIKATGGGQSRSTPLTPLQERLYNILGRDFGEPLPGIRHNPLSQHNHVSEAEVLGDAVPLARPLRAEQEQEVVDDYEELVLDATASNSRECATGPTASTSRALATGPIPSTSREPVSDATASDSRERTTGPTASTSRALAMGPIPSTSREPVSYTTASDSRERATGPTASTSRELPPVATRRRRRRQQHNHDTENEPAMRQATEHLEAMERLNAEATRELAQATHRQAAALETIGQVLRDLINQSNEGRSPRRRIKRIRVVYSSDDE